LQHRASGHVIPDDFLLRSIYEQLPSLVVVTSKSTSIASDAVSDSGLPDFAQPPVDETALSLQFAPLAGFGIPHFGLYWQKIRSDYPKYEIQQPIPSVQEQLATNSRTGMGMQFGISLVAAPEIRCWFLDSTGNRLLQIQNDRFVLNWRKITGAEAYPRYPTSRESLRMEWGRFCDFLNSEKLESPKVNQCEVTYVNHIEYEKGWQGYGELDKVVAALATPKAKNRFLPDPERVNMQVVYRLGDNAGRLYVSFVPVIRVRDSKEVLQMTLIARGAPKSSSIDDVFQWLDLGRRWVVRGFADFTTEGMHRVWGKQ
jgi:uncharacterized protein (TIGR04255 family)